MTIPEFIASSAAFLDALGRSCKLADWPSVDCRQLAAAVMPAACCGMGGNGVANETR